MSSKKKPSAPANRVYKSSTPLRQTRFPVRSTRVKYGKQISKRVPKQETLTQMDFVNLQRRLDENDEDDEDLGTCEEDSEKPKRKRRKTTDDEPSNSTYHTQTITQLGWNSTLAVEEDDSIYDVPSSSPQSGQLQRKQAIEEAIPAKRTTRHPSKRQSAPGSMAPPQTPRQRSAQEIPSSESPATPPSRTSTLKRSFMKERSVNLPISFDTTPKSPSSLFKPPKLEIEDTFDSVEDISQQIRMPSTPSKRSSPPKSVRFVIPDEITKNLEVTTAIKRELRSQLSVSPKTMSQALLKAEILDSDVESDEGLDEEHRDTVEEEQEGDEEQPETYYGEIGLDTQLAAEQGPSACVEETQMLAEEISETLTEERTQFMESQRLSTQHVVSMAPRTADSDIFISLHPQHVTKIVNRSKDHEFRVWRIPPTVSRLWIYETAPTSTLKYMAAIGPVKCTGEILNEHGDGNVSFNAKPPGTREYAYEIIELFELADPLSLDQIKSNEWLKGPPQKFAWVRPAVLDQLIANLKPPLFSRDSSTQEPLSSSSTDMQEAENQLISNIIQFTQRPPTGIYGSQTSREDPLDVSYLPFSTQKEPSPTPQTPTKLQESPQNLPEPPRPSQAETVDLTQSQTPRHHSTADVIWESPTRPVFSSTPRNMSTPFEASSTGQESLVPYSITSSQLLAKSQMLPESLLNESIPGPPSFIQDSDEDDE